MQRLRGKNLLLVGFTLFSMFFGAGNLIFPPFLGAQAGTNTWPAMAGFILSAIGFPVLGVIAVAKADGLRRLAGRVHPVFAAVFTLLVYLSIGPGLAIPRTASTSFETVSYTHLLIFECPMIYCKSFGFMFLLASLVQNVWRSVCGVICGKGLSLWCLLYFFTIRTKSRPHGCPNRLGWSA